MDLKIIEELTWEGQAKESKSLVFEIVFIPSSILSTAGHEKSRRNLGGPSPNPKYSLVTDSEPVP